MITHKKDLLALVAAVILLPLSSLTLDAQGSASNASARGNARVDDPRPRALLFTENIGQWGPEVGFQGTIGSTTMRFERDGVSYSYLVDSTEERSSSTATRFHTLRTEFIGARADARMVGEKGTITRFNYYLGADSSRWFTGARGFEGVRYRGIYDGIDALYHGYGERVKYDFIVAPGADHRVIRLRYRGASRLRVLASGEMEAATGFGSVKEAPPYSYQEIGGRRIEVKARYRLLGDDTYGFELGPHDADHPVVIDPCLSVEYSTFFGGGSYDIVTGIAVDSSGASYATGFTRAPDFPVIPERELPQLNYVFISKISKNGRQLLYSTVVAETYKDHYAIIADSGFSSTIHYESIGEDVEVTRNGEAVIALTTNIDDLPTGGNVYQRRRAAENINSDCGPPFFRNFDCYVARFDASGGLAWGTYLGGSNEEYLSDIALDVDGNIYLTGLTAAPECGTRGDALSFPTTIPKSSFGSSDTLRNFETFATVLAADGRTLRFSAIYGGTGDEFPTRIAVDPSGRMYLFGSTNSTDLPTTPNAYQRTAQQGIGPGVFDLYIARINPMTGELEYSSYFADNGGSGRKGLGVGPLYRRDSYAMFGGFDRQDRRQGLLVEGTSGVIVFGGSTRSTSLPATGGAFQGGHRRPGSDSGGIDCYVVRMNLNTNQLLGSTYLGGSDLDAFGGLTLDRFGDIVVGISTRSKDFPLSVVNIQPALRGEVDLVVASISPDATRLTYSTYFGGTKPSGTYLWEQSVNGVTADPEGGIYVVGGTSSRDIPLTPGALNRSNDYYGGYIIKFLAPTAPKIGAGVAINFEPNLCGDVQIQRQMIFNSGQTPMRVESLGFLSGKFCRLVNPPNTPFTLAPCDTLTLTVAFDATNLECRTRAVDSLIIVAPDAVEPRVAIGVTGRRTCVSFAFFDTVVNVERFKLNSGRFIGFGINVRGDFPQYLTITPDPGNTGAFTPATPVVDKVFPEGTSGVAFQVNVTDTGYYCETFTAQIGPCPKTVRLKLCARVTSGFFTARDSIAYGLISCKEIVEPFVVRNTGNDTLIVNVLYVGGPNPFDINFLEDVQTPRKVGPKDSTIFNFAVRPLGPGRHESIIVFQTDEGGENGTQHWITISSELDSVAFRLTTTNVIGGFGEIVSLPVDYTPYLEGRVPLEELTLRANYDPKLLEVHSLDPRGALMAGWEITEKKYQPDGAIFKLRKGGSGATFSGPGRLMNLQVKVLRGDTMASPLDLVLEGASKGCLVAEIDSGRVFQLNAECAAALRLLYTNRQFLKQSIPNPASSTVTIPYRVPEPGYTTLTLYDLAGREVLRLIDGDLPDGEGEASFDARILSPGIYYYRLTVGTSLSETRRMVIER